MAGVTLEGVAQIIAEFAQARLAERERWNAARMYYDGAPMNTKREPQVGDVIEYEQAANQRHGFPRHFANGIGDELDEGSTGVWLQSKILETSFSNNWRIGGSGRSWYQSKLYGWRWPEDSPQTAETAPVERATEPEHYFETLETVPALPDKYNVMNALNDRAIERERYYKRTLRECPICPCCGERAHLLRRRGLSGVILIELQCPNRGE